MTSTRHKWIERDRLERVTIRQCTRCGMFKNTRHEPYRLPWLVFVLECEEVDSSAGTPPCDARLEGEELAEFAAADRDDQVVVEEARA